MYLTAASVRDNGIQGVLLEIVPNSALSFRQGFVSIARVKAL
jgi:hypothetical protein